MTDFSHKKIIAFDLDGTLAESKSPITDTMASLFSRLVAKKRVAIISGGTYEQIRTQVVANLSPETHFSNLFLLPTSGTRMYTWENDAWKEVYKEELSPEEQKKIYSAFETVMQSPLYSSLRPEGSAYGAILENRGSQITFSACGQQAPLSVKEKWDPSRDKRAQMILELEKYIPEYAIKSGGVSSIDVVKKGIDKAYGMQKIRDVLGIDFEDMLFVGDALYEGGNDYAVQKIGIDCVPVANPKETEILIASLL